VRDDIKHIQQFALSYWRQRCWSRTSTPLWLRPTTHFTRAYTCTWITQLWERRTMPVCLEHLQAFYASTLPKWCEVPWIEITHKSRLRGQRTAEHLTEDPYTHSRVAGLIRDAQTSYRNAFVRVTLGLPDNSSTAYGCLLTSRKIWRNRAPLVLFLPKPL
jgi:hypothetical protein